MNKIGELLSAYTYSFDKVGNRLSMTEAINGGDYLTTRYEYDDFYRLTHVDYPETPAQGYPEDERFEYDMAGNRVSLIKEESGQIDYSYNWADILKTIRGYENFDFLFDPNGNQMEKYNVDAGTSTLYSYDFDNMLTHVQGPGFDNSIAYDVQGKRWSLKQTNNETIHYVYDREDILMEYDDNLNLQCRYTHGPLIDEPISQTRLYTDPNPSWKKQYFHRDGLGSVTLVSGSLGGYQASYAYTAFGELNDQISHLNQVTNSYAFTGRNLDFESNLYNYRSRMYDAGVGRFLTQDSFAGREFAPPSLHRYTYTHNNPVNWTDAFGYSQQPSTGQWVFAIFMQIISACSTFLTIAAIFLSLETIGAIAIASPVLTMVVLIIIFYTQMICLGWIVFEITWELRTLGEFCSIMNKLSSLTSLLFKGILFTVLSIANAGMLALFFIFQFLEQNGYDMTAIRKYYRYADTIRKCIDFALKFKVVVP